MKLSISKPALGSLLITILLTAPSWARMTPATDVVSFQQQVGITQQNVLMKNEQGVGKARLLSFNPSVGTWFLLYVQWPGDSNWTPYHLENPEGTANQLRMTESGLQISSSTGVKVCNIYSELVAADQNSRAYAPLCDKKLFLRHREKGDAGGTQEWGANFARDHFGSLGDALVDTVKEHRDVPGDQARLENNTGAKPVDQKDEPLDALINKDSEQKLLNLPKLRIALKDGNHSVAPGAWYPLKYQSGVYFSAMQAELVDPHILENHKERVKEFDGVEEHALDYMVAFDLSRFNIGWSHGTKLPGVAWSRRNNADSDKIPNGPDGFANLDPLAQTGILNPIYFSRLTATMCGGFQRLQAVFKYGALAQKNHGSYYGFLQEGVVLSTLNPGLATFIIYNDGRIEIKTWTEDDDRHISEIRYARQNGVSLVEKDSSGTTVPGASVGNWGEGNWSGSTNDLPKDDPTVKGLLRSQRAGACIAHHDGKEFLIYGYFSAATPTVMARVFQSYQCDYAIHLDMNSAGQGYLGILSNEGGNYVVEHPVAEMSDRDSTMKISGPSGDRVIPTPRFAGKPDEADFFYFLRKN